MTSLVDSQRSSLLGIFACAWLLFAWEVCAQQAEGSFVVTDVRLFDGERVTQRTNVVVVEGIIRAIGGQLDEWRELPRIDGTGATLLPGFIDAHVHVRSADDLRDALRFGVTTVLDMGATVDPAELFALRTMARASPDMADMRLAGFLARASDRPDPRISIPVPAVTNVEDARRFVAARHEEGANHVKLALGGVRAEAGIPTLDAPRVAALVETAHAHDMLAVAHIETVGDAAVALDADIDGLMHIWRRGGPNAEINARIAASGAFVVAVLTIPDGLVSPEGRLSLLADPRFAGRISAPMRSHLERDFTPLPPPQGGGVVSRAVLDAQIDAVRAVHVAGGTVLVGTDANAGNPVAFGISLHRELELLHRAGLEPTEALRAATAASAAAFGLDDRGVIAVGRRADLVLVRGDPTTDVLATRDLLRVWKNGVELRLAANTGRQR